MRSVSREGTPALSTVTPLPNVRLPTHGMEPAAAGGGKTPHPQELPYAYFTNLLGNI
jgi:hypothetical protein